MPASGPVLFCVDGSSVALGALKRGLAVLVPGPAVALCVWQPAMVLHPARLEALMELTNPASEIDAASARAASEIAGAAAATARTVGFTCTPRSCRSENTEWQEILEQADELDASTIVIGSQGRSALAERALGGAAHRVLSHAQRPVLMVAAAVARASC